MDYFKNIVRNFVTTRKLLVVVQITSHRGNGRKAVPGFIIGEKRMNDVFEDFPAWFQALDEKSQYSIFRKVWIRVFKQAVKSMYNKPDYLKDLIPIIEIYGPITAGILLWQVDPELSAEIDRIVGDILFCRRESAKNPDVFKEDWEGLAIAMEELES